MTSESATTRVAKNTAWNVLGQVLPMAVGVITIPVLIRQLGIDRFGFMTLAWTLIGYAGLFDFGMSRAMTRVVARHIAIGDSSAARHSGLVGLNYMVAIGCVIAATLALAAPVIVERWLGLPVTLERE